MDAVSKVIAYSFAYLLLLGAWVYIIVAEVEGASQLVAYIQTTLSAFTGHVLTMIQVGKGD